MPVNINGKTFCVEINEAILKWIILVINKIQVRPVLIGTDRKISRKHFFADAEVKQETNLWPYVSFWIKDDHNVFDVSTGKVTITQNANKFASISEEIFTRDFSIGADKDGPYLNFVNYQYNPLKYRLVNFDAEGFTVYVDWHSGAKVFSDFVVVP